MKEYVGQVSLCYDYYKGSDVYSDGTIEDQLLTIVKEYNPEEFDKIILENYSWPLFYHLSALRQNIVEWLPIDKEQIILEIGSGCGAITGVLADKGKMVTCVELSKKRSLINGYRNREKNNISIMVGNFQNIYEHFDEKYDVITLIGVYEYAESYIESNTPYIDFLKMIQQLLKPNGRILIAIENKFGLKYWAGCQEDHIGGYFSGIAGYSENSRVKTFGKNELERMFAEAGLKIDYVAYPYPDYKFPTEIYTDAYLPKIGALKNNQRNFDQARVEFFDESKVFDQLIAEELFPQFSNSFLYSLKL